MVDRLPAAILLGINALFVLKYGEGVGPLAAPWYALGWTAASAVGLAVLVRVEGRLAPTRRVAGLLLALLLAAFVVTALTLLARIDRESVAVDRWSAIEHWLDLLVAGRYPYDALTHLGQYASPFPTWQLIHLPFHALGDVGLAQVVALPATAICVAWLTRDPRLALGFTVLMLVSPAFWYEVAVRSDLMTNLLVALVAVVLLATRPDLARRRPMAVAVMAGLLLSTRLLLAIPLAVSLVRDLWRLRRRPGRLAGVCLVTGLAFTLPFLPFVLWGFDPADPGAAAFLRHNPFILQTNKLDGPIVLAALGVASLWSFRVSGLGRTLVAIAATLAGMMLALLVRGLVLHGWDAVRLDIVDLAYVATPLPFAALAIAVRMRGAPR